MKINLMFEKISAFLVQPKLLFWTFLLMLVFPNLIMFFTESTSTLVRVVNVLLPLAAYWFALTLSPKPGKAFWMLFLFLFFDAFQVVLLYLFGESPIAVDMFLNVVTTNPNEVDELLSQLMPSVIFVIVFYGGGLILAVCSWRSKHQLDKSIRKRQRAVSLLLLGIAVILLVVCYLTPRRFSMRDDIFPVNATYNFLLSFDRQWKSQHYSSTSASFSHHARITRPDSVPEIYVLVVNETLRAENMGVYGYGRETTPHLAEMESGGEVVVFSDAITMSNTTHKSVPLLLSAVGSEESFDSLYCQKGIISAFKEAGFSTAFFSNQRRNHSLIDYFGLEADDVRFVKDGLPLTANVYDERLVELLKEKVSGFSSGKLMIVLHCYGSHFDYRDRCPDSLTVFNPIGFPTAGRRYKEQLVNAYDNTVLYADHVFNRLAEILRSKDMPALMIFTSDHGEDIFDDARNRFLHASPIPTYHQLNVPYVVWSSASWRDAHATEWQQLTAHKNVPISTNVVTFHTLLDAAGVTVDLYRPDLSLTRESFAAPKRLYVNDHNEYRTLDDCGLKKADEEQFRKSNRRYP